MNTLYAVSKRFFDILLSGLSIVVLSPVLLLCALILWATGEHLIIYRQPRIGKDYRPFNIYKFVTMRSDSEKYGTITAKYDPRVLPVGRFFRKTKINELPQLFNILFGHMSIVGPRPLVQSEVDMYPENVRSLVYADNTPGLTGMGSLFFRDEDELIEATAKAPEVAYREDIMPIKGALEAWYREHKSLRVDAKIVFLTAWALLRPECAPVVKSFVAEADMPKEVVVSYEKLLESAK